MRVLHAAPILLSLLAITPASAASQTVGIHPPAAVRPYRVRDTTLVNALNNFGLLGEGAPVKGSDLAVRLLSVPGQSGSAGDSESDEVVYWLYVAVSEFGELPEQRLYRLGPFFSPALDSLVAQDSVPVAFVTYGLPGKRQRVRIAATLDSAHVTAVRPRRP